ncbi:hypothetical protein CGRA01v4_04717 [Colletotrichum graminicola]|nr:hypothetical protein CGRA01v4_04717 [Colletotrichum graminicola]
MRKSMALMNVRKRRPMSLSTAVPTARSPLARMPKWLALRTVRAKLPQLRRTRCQTTAASTLRARARTSWRKRLRARLSMTMQWTLTPRPTSLPTRPARPRRSLPTRMPPWTVVLTLLPIPPLFLPTSRIFHKNMRRMAVYTKNTTWTMIA